MPTLLEMPAEIMQEIVDFVGCPGIFTFRNVCHDLRTFVDNMKPNLKLDALGIRISSDTLGLDCSENNINYRKKFNKSEVDEFFKMLETILKLQKSTLTIFAIDDKSPMPRFYDKIEGILESRTSPLKVFELSMKCAYQYQIYSIMSTLEPGTLERIWLDGRHFENLQLSEVVGLEQWKRASTLHIHTSTVFAPLIDFAHFKRVFALFRSVDWEDLDALKNIFLTSPNTKRSFDIYLRKLNDYNQWRESLGPAMNERGWEPEWRFRYPNNGGILRVAKLSDRIVFETID